MPDEVRRPGLWKRRLKVTLLILGGLLALPIVVGMVAALVDPDTWTAKPSPKPAAPSSAPPPVADRVETRMDSSLLPILNFEISIPKDQSAQNGLHAAATEMAALIRRMNRGAYPTATYINVMISPGIDTPHLAHVSLPVVEAKQHIHIGGSPDGLFGITHEWGLYGAANERAVASYCTAYPDAARLCENR